MRGRRWLLGLGVIFGAVLGCVLFLPDPATTAQWQMRDSLLEAGFQLDMQALNGPFEGQVVGVYTQRGLSIEELNRFADSMLKGRVVGYSRFTSQPRLYTDVNGRGAMFETSQYALLTSGAWGDVRTVVWLSESETNESTCTAVIVRDVRDPWALALASVGL